MLLPYEFARILNVPQESGMLIQHVVKGSPAGTIGLKGGYRLAVFDDQEILLGGDILLSVDHIRFTSPDSFYELMEYMNGIEDSHKYHLKVLRAGEVMDFYWISSAF